MEHNLNQHPDKWALDIHDAILCLPGHASQFRHTASARLKFYNDNRYKIVQRYRESIGATTPKSDIQYMKLLDLVQDAGKTEFLPTLMK